MMRFLDILLLCFVVTVILSCEELMPYVSFMRGNEWNADLQEQWYLDSLLNRNFTGVEVALRRAEQFANIQ